MYLIYNLLLLFVLLATFPYLIVKLAVSEKFYTGLKERLGVIPEEIKRDLIGKKCLWMHAASVGEVITAESFLYVLHKRYPDVKLVVSTMTKTGNLLAKDKFAKIAHIIFLPLDFPWVVNKTIRDIDPNVFILKETEIWPNLLRKLAKKKVSILLINGRISDRSFKKYRFIKFFLEKILKYITLFGMQTSLDAERIIKLGADTKKVTVTGNLKFDQAVSQLIGQVGDEREVSDKQNSPPEFRIMIAGSTHQGEDEIIIEVYQEVIKKYPKIILIIAPRHLERIKNIESLLDSKNLEYVKRTNLVEKDIKTFASVSSFPAPVVILDTLGELVSLYSIGDIIFVGGSLVPVGGHNILEPAVYGKPVIFGPYMANFLECSQILESSGGGIKISNAEELQSKIEELLSNHKRYVERGQAALEVVKKNQGAVQKSIALIEKYL